MRIRRAAAAVAVTAAAALLVAPAPAWAHTGGLVEKEDLPIPRDLFIFGAAGVLVVSFVALMLAWREPVLERRDWRALPAGLSRLALNPVTAALAGAVGVLLLGVVVWAGLEGTEAPNRNFAVPFVFVTFWLGLALLSVVLGDVFRAFNPWRAIARGFVGVFRLVARQSPPPLLGRDAPLNRWPAVVGILGFVWLEFVYGQSGFGVVGLTPRTLAIAALAYSAYALMGMALYGIDRWCERGEAFSVYFGMFASMAPLEARGGRLGARWPLLGLKSWAAIPGSVALVLVALGATVYDGARETLLQPLLDDTRTALVDGGMAELTAFRLTGTIYLMFVIAAVAAVYWAGVAGMKSVPTDRSVGALGRLFAHSFVPIAFAYLIAHYFTLVLYQEQAQFTFLLSDPLGDGSDLFGTAGGGIDYGVISADAIAWTQVGILLAGHVAGLVLAHDRALSVYGDPRRGTISQLWMLALMVGFTTLGLILLYS